MKVLDTIIIYRYMIPLTTSFSETSERGWFDCLGFHIIIYSFDYPKLINCIPFLLIIESFSFDLITKILNNSENACWSFVTIASD